MPCQLDQMCAFGEFFGGKGIWKDKGFDFFKDENHLFFVVNKKHFEGLISKIITAKKLKNMSLFFRAKYTKSSGVQTRQMYLHHFVHNKYMETFS